MDDQEQDPLPLLRPQRAKRAKAGVGSATDWLPTILAVQPALLQGMSERQFAALLAEAPILHLRRPKTVLRQGEPADHAYLILKGRIEVTFMDDDGNRILAHLAVPGEILGEVEQFSGRVCAASCITLPDTTLALLDDAMLLRHLPADRLLRNMASIFHDRLTRDNRQHSVAMFYDAEERVRIHLLSMTTPDTPAAKINQTDLAGFAGCSRQTVNRTLSQLRAEGIVEMTRGTVRVLDRARLESRRPGGR